MKKKRVAPNLYRQTGGGRDSWLYRYERNGKSIWLGLGSARKVPLSKAKAKRDELNAMRMSGDPLAERRAGREKQKREQVTFKEFAEPFVAAHIKTLRNAASQRQWPNSLATYVYPKIGNLRVCDVEAVHVAKVLEPIWLDKAETARRVRARIERIMDAAEAAGLRSGRNPASLNLVRPLLPRKKRAAVKHFAMLPYQDLPALVAELKGRENVSARALLFCMLTLARTGEVIGAEWSEIDTKAKLWRIPAGRTKTDRAHAVPLTSEALAVLETLPRSGEYVFAGPRGKLSQMAILEQLRGMRGRVTVHGTVRAGFRSWAAEKTDVPVEIVEGCLAHVQGKLTRAYQRGELLEKRRELLRQWAAFCYGRKVVKPQAKPAPGWADTARLAQELRRRR